MKLRRKFVIVTVTALVLVFLCAQVTVFAEDNFIIRDYDIQMVVNEDDTYQITETIDVEFTEPSHGIYRIIPLKTRLKRDGQSSTYTAEVYDFKVLSGQDASVKTEDGNAYYHIGDPDQFADTHTQYQITYLYDTGGDHLKGGDEVYHNIVGTQWEAQGIDHVSFEIVFPKDIDMSKVGIITGRNVNVPFEAPDARTIRGETTEHVLAGLTIRAVMPEGYFTRQAANVDHLFYVLAGLLGLLAAAGVVLWHKYGRDPVYPVTLQLYPPENLSAPETAYLLNEEIYGKDVISMLLSLADKGYIRIKEEEPKKGFLGRKKKPDYTLEKLKDYDGDNKEEQMFMDGLFPNIDSVSVAALRNVFYVTASKIAKSIEEKYKGKLYDKTAADKAKILYIGGVVSYAILIGGSMMINGLWQDGSLGFLMPVGVASLGSFLIGLNIRKKKGITKYFFPAILTAAGCAVGLILTAGVTPTQLIPAVVGAVFCLMLFILGGLCEKKTEYYAKLKSEIKGYRDFLRTAEKDQMEELAERDPEYYFHNLAYAFALGITAVYAKRFAGMASAPPDWYASPTLYDSSLSDSGFLDAINNMADSVSSAMSSRPSDSSDGGGSFSGGGGGGGGGGGSW